MTVLDILATTLRDEAIQVALDHDGEREIDWTVELNERAYELVNDEIGGSSKSENQYIIVIEEYLAIEDGWLEDRNAIDLVGEYYDEEDGSISNALKTAASVCLMHRVLDDLETLGVKEEPEP